MAVGQRKRATIPEIRIDGLLAFVPLTRGLEAVVDAADAALFAGFNWHAKAQRRTWIAARNRHRSEGPGPAQVLMHHVLCPQRPGYVTDHWDGNGLNNRRKNLRSATFAQNRHNSVGWGPYGKGVSKRGHRYRAAIQIGEAQITIGTYDTASEAQEAYAREAVRHHGEFSLPTGVR